jgi:hypothetical protein
MKKTCPDCGTTISDYYYKRCHVCSGRLMRGSKSPHWKGGKPKCKDCGKRLSSYYAKRCRKCAIIRKMKTLKKLYGPDNPCWRGGKPTCNKCGKKLANYGATRCAKCYVDSLKGPNHPSWRGGKSFEIYPLGWNNTFKEQIRFRDGYKCQMCGVPEAECKTKLHVHHIDYNKRNINKDNLISLCSKCHVRTNVEREFWTTYFNKPEETLHEFNTNI